MECFSSIHFYYNSSWCFNNFLGSFIFNSLSTNISNMPISKLAVVTTLGKKKCNGKARSALETFNENRSIAELSRLIVEST